MFHKLRNQMKWIIIAIAVAFAATLLYVGGSNFIGQAPAAEAVAKVNGDSISEFELHQAYLNLMNTMNSLGQQISRVQEEDARFNALQQLVDERLMLQSAKRERIKADEKEVRAQVDEIKDALGDQYANFLRQQGLNEQSLRNIIRENVLLQTVYEQKSHVDISDEEVFKTYQEEVERRDVRHILIEIPFEDGEFRKEEALEMAEDVKRRLDAGEDFAALAEELSDDTGSAQQGGSLGLIGRNDPLVPEFLDRTFTLAEGEVSEPVESSFGYHIIQVTEITVDEDAEPFEEVEATYRNRLEQTKRNEKFTRWIEEERDNAEVAVYDPQLRAYQLARAGRLDQAIEQYRQAIELRPNDAYLLYHLATVLEQVDAPEEALETYARAAEEGLTDPFLWMALGDAYGRSDEPERAIDAYGHASEFSSGDPQMHYFLSFAYDQLGYEDLAEAEREKAMQLQEEMLALLESQGDDISITPVEHDPFLEQERQLLEQSTGASSTDGDADEDDEDDENDENDTSNESDDVGEQPTIDRDEAPEFDEDDAR